MKDTQATSGNVLCWPKRLLSAEDLRRHLTSQRELLLLPKTVVTPLAADELRAKGVRILWEVPTKETNATLAGTWCYAVDKPDVVIRSVIQALERDGMKLTAIKGSPSEIAETILREGWRGAIVVTIDAALVCCITNKIAGVRAVVVDSARAVAKAKKSFAANLFALETDGRTFFELRQMLKAIVTGDTLCPADVATTLQELDGHAHR